MAQRIDQGAPIILSPRGVLLKEGVPSCRPFYSVVLFCAATDRVQKKFSNIRTVASEPLATVLWVKSQCDGKGGAFLSFVGHVHFALGPFAKGTPRRPYTPPLGVVIHLKGVPYPFRSLPIIFA